jgi:hypothetical protein
VTSDWHDDWLQACGITPEPEPEPERPEPLVSEPVKAVTSVELEKGLRGIVLDQQLRKKVDEINTQKDPPRKYRITGGLRAIGTFGILTAFIAIAIITSDVPKPKISPAESVSIRFPGLEFRPSDKPVNPPVRVATLVPEIETPKPITTIPFITPEKSKPIEKSNPITAPPPETKIPFQVGGRAIWTYGRINNAIDCRSRSTAVPVTSVYRRPCFKACGNPAPSPSQI